MMPSKDPTCSCALRQAERDDDATTVAAALGILRRLHGAAIPEPTATHVSRWGSDPYSLGAAVTHVYESDLARKTPGDGCTMHTDALCRRNVLLEV